MAYATRTYTPGSSTTTFALTTSGGDPIGYIQESDIAVKVNGTTYTNAASGTNTYQITGSSTVEQPNGGNVVLNAGVTGTVVLDRTTAIQNATVVYTAGSTLTSTDLNNADNQIRFGLQEFSDDYAALFTGTGTLTSLGGFKGGSDTWVSSDAFAATTAAIDGQIDTKATAKVKDDIIATAPVSIADDSPSAGKITVSVDAKLTELATMDQNTANSLADLTQAEVQTLDGITATTAELNYVDGVTSNVQTQLNAKQASATDLTNLSSMQTGASAELASLTSTELDILDGATVTTAEVNILDGVTSTTAELNILDGVTSTAAELNILDGVTATAAELNIVDGVTATTAEINVLDGVTASTAELNLMDGVTATTAEINYVDGVTSNVQTQLDAKQPLDADLTTLAGMQGATASILAGGTALTSTLTELNQIDGKTIGETTLTTNSNTALPTSKAVADHVSGAVTAVGGFIAIATDAAFPATASIPASGVVVSISDAGGIVINGSGVSTTGRTTDGTPATVTINNFPSSLYSETLVAGVGLQVTSTGSSNTYNYHKLLAKEGDVKELSDDINDFNERYRTGNSDPGSNNDEGDLFFNKTSNTMKVYDGSTWGEVTSTGDFKFLFLCPTGGSGAPTIDGSVDTYDLREVSNTGTGASVTNAAQLVVSVNGVIQQPNPGVSTSGLDGFVMTDANTIKFAANLPNGADVFVIQVGSAVTLNSPANNTVSTDVLQNLAVNNAKIAEDTIAESKLDIHAAPSGTDKFLGYTSNGMEWAVPPDLNILSGGTITGDVVFDNATNAGNDLTWDMSDNALEFDDSVKATFGDDGDLEIYHDGHSRIKTASGATGNLVIDSNNDINLRVNNSEMAVHCYENGAVELYYDNVKEIATKSGGVKLFGHSESVVNALGNTTGSTTIDFSVANHISATLTGNTTFANPTTESIGQSGTITLTQDGTGSRTGAWGSQFKWTGGAAPTLSTAANAVDRIDYVVVAADTIHCVASLAVA